MALGWAEFQRAMDGCEGVLRWVPDDRWGSPSPCEGWSAEDVARHLTTEVRWAAELVAANERPSASGEEEPSQNDVPLQVWLTARRQLEAVCTPDSLERRVRWPFGEQTVNRGLGLFLLEVLVHTWDIARAVDLDVTLHPDLVHDHFVRLQRVGHLLRGPGMYGSELPAPPEASEQLRLLAFLGRQV